MASMDSVHQKMYRARAHYLELREKLVEYYTTIPGSFEEGAGSTPETPLAVFREHKPIPKSFPLILGDALQCMRSCLDYLIYELVESRNKTHHRRSQFPIANTRKDYAECIRGHMLDGIVADACTVIHALQPMNSNDPQQHPLAILNKLVNVNKHRRVILTNFASHNVSLLDRPTFPNLRGDVRATSLDTGKVINLPMCAYVTITDELTLDTEIITLIEMMSDYLIKSVFPLFEHYFK